MDWRITNIQEEHCITIHRDHPSQCRRPLPRCTMMMTVADDSHLESFTAGPQTKGPGGGFLEMFY